MRALEDYLTSSGDPEREFIDGELVDRNIGGVLHSAAVGMVAMMLYNRRHEHGIYVYPSLSIQVAANRVRIPDITVTLRKGGQGILRDPPFLCIEILSQEDRGTRIESKIVDYLKFGVRHIWIIDPARRTGWCHTRGGQRESSEILTTTEPRLGIPLKELFEALIEDIEIEDLTGDER